uniref:Putative secreted protein n=1 Tax=Anopheles darlingi TaxID=43151 RepID=A0A2M4D982_ANODA
MLAMCSMGCCCCCCCYCCCVRAALIHVWLKLSNPNPKPRPKTVGKQLSTIRWSGLLTSPTPLDPANKHSGCATS